MFGLKGISKSAKHAKKIVARQHKQVRNMLAEGPIELTVRSGTQSITLTPSLDFLNQVLGDLSIELFKRYTELKQEQKDQLRQHLLDKEQERQQKEAQQEKEWEERHRRRGAAAKAE
jgi:hypothetical protein